MQALVARDGTSAAQAMHTLAGLIEDWLVTPPGLTPDTARVERSKAWLVQTAQECGHPI